MSKKKTTSSNTIALNRKARHDYSILESFEAGLVLEGWEVKGMRAGRCQLKDSYVIIKKGEAWLLNAHVSPLSNVPAHVKPEPERRRKLLLHKRELNKLIGATKDQGITLIPLALFWKRNKVKLEFALAKGKKSYDKRESEKRKDWDRQKQRLLRSH